MFIAAVFTIARTWKQSKCPSTGIDKEDVIHTHTHTMQYYLAINNSICSTWMNLEIVILSETVRQRRTNTLRYCLDVEPKYNGTN